MNLGRLLSLVELSPLKQAKHSPNVIGFYPTPREGELLYSTTAIAMRSCCNGGNMVDRARYLGGQCRSFGVVIPGYARALQAHVPDIAGLTDNRVIESSGYYAIAPFLGTEKAATLREEIFSESPQPKNRILARRNELSLRYCLLCAREDHEAGERPIWAIEANLFGSSCCPRHGRLLSDSHLTPGGRNVLFSPIESIKLNAKLPPKGSHWEIEVARDLQFLIAQKGRLMPGRNKVGLSLGVEFHKIARFVGRNGRFNAASIASEIETKMGSTVRSLDPDLLGKGRITGIIHGWYDAPYQSYSLLAQFIGLNLRSIMPKIAATEIDIRLLEDRNRKRYLKVLGGKLLRPEEAKSHAIGLLKSPPAVRIGSLGVLMPREIEQTRKAYPEWSRRNHKRIERWKVKYWRAADILAHGQIQHRVTRDALTVRTHVGFTRGSVLRIAGLPMTLLKMHRGKLPKTEKIVQGLIATRDRMQIDKNRHIVKCAMALDPSASKEQLKEWCDSEITLLQRKDPDWLRQKLPSPQIRRRHWIAKDHDVAEKLMRVDMATEPQGQMPMSFHRIAMLAGLTWNNYESLYHGLLPCSRRIAERMISQHLILRKKRVACRQAMSTKRGGIRSAVND